MTITPSTIYWIGNCDSMVSACICICVISIALGALFGPVAIALERVKLAGWMIVLFLVIGFFGIAGAAFIPSSKTAAAMYIVPAIVNNEKVQTLGNGIYDLAVEWMKELKPKNCKDNSNTKTENK